MERVKFYHANAKRKQRCQKDIHFKGELNPKIKFVLFERTLKITE